MSERKKSIEQRIEEIERWINSNKPIIAGLAKEYDLQKPRTNPAKYCKDTLDKEIINYLIEKLGAGTTEIANALKPQYPEVNRHTIGKRILRLQKQASFDGWHILTFDTALREVPNSQEKKYRAWWITIEDLDIASFKKDFQPKDDKINEKQPTQ